MSLFGSLTRDQLRQTYTDAWRRRLEGAPLSALQAMIADVIGLHPEYWRTVEHPERVPAVEPQVAPAGENPFLHLGLHMAVREQIAIDRPPGVRDLERQLRARLNDPHGAEHILMESLAETLWEAQRAGCPPDDGRYLSLTRRRLSGLTT